jgi:RNA-binding protein
MSEENRVELSGAEKRELKSRAQLLEPVVRLGNGGMNEAVIRSLDEALSVHGLVKLRFSGFKEDKKSLAPQLAEATRSTLVQLVGNVAVFFRRKPRE